MIRKVFGRAFVLALILIINHSVAYAHSLPGSVLTLVEQAEQIELNIRFPLEDFLVAAPELAGLEKLEGSVLPPNETQRLAAYFKAHLSIKKEGQPLTVVLQKASLEAAYNKDVGHYVLVVSQLTAPKPESEALFPLAFSYDVIMHEVRNHRASLYWSPSNEEPIHLINFGFATINGQPKINNLSRP